MNLKIVSNYQVQKRAYWVNEIVQLSGNFGADSARAESEVTEEIATDGIDSLIGHLRLCGSIPERYSHDSSEEKLYSKYTDIVLSKAFEFMGMESLVLTERADAADVECVTDDYSFVADAKAFRLSRTAKNQKDFKVQSMDNWKHGKPYAVVVAPIYQLPSRTSQIYQQAITRSVCIFSYTHLSVLVRYSELPRSGNSVELMHEIFRTIESLHPSKDATQYWAALNAIMLNHGDSVRELWREEKLASDDSIIIAKDEALSHLSEERERLMRLSKQDAICELIKFKKIDSKEETIRAVAANGLLDAS